MLPEHAVETFRTDGAVALRGLLDATWIQALRDAAGELLEGSYDPQARMRAGASSPVLQSSGKWQESEVFGRFLAESPIADASAQLMASGSARLFEDLFQLRPPGGGEPSWHRDAPYWPVTGAQVTNAWFTLEAVTPYAGGIHVVAGSHRDDDAVVKSVRQPDASRHVLAFGCEPGDVMIFHPRALHTGFGADPERPRRTFTIRFLGDDVRWRPAPAYYHPWMAETGLQAGDVLDHPGFPVMWPPALAPTR